MCVVCVMRPSELNFTFIFMPKEYIKKNYLGLCTYCDDIVKSYNILKNYMKTVHQKVHLDNLNVIVVSEHFITGKTFYFLPTLIEKIPHTGEKASLDRCG